LKHSNSSQR